MKFVEYNDISYVIGENANDNWNILDIYSNINNKYIWFHLNSFSSPYVIMLSSNNIECNLNYGAFLCKNNTKYKNIQNLKICYTTLSKLKKTEKIGEVEIKGKKNIIKL